MAKAKIQITMDDELLKSVDDYCDKHYMNRSWMISQAVIQLVNQQKMFDAITDMSFALKKAIEQGTIDDDMKKEMEAFEVLCKFYLGK